MKNDSPLFPFNMPGDSFFDSNKDGKLTGFETVMRDAHHLEMMNKANQKAKAKSENNTPLYHYNDTVYNPTPIANDKKEQPKQQTDSGGMILACSLVILFVIIAFAVAINTEKDFIRALAMFGSVGLGVIVLKAFGLLKT